MRLLAAWPASLPSATQTLENEPVSRRIAKGAIPLKKVGLRLNALPGSVVAVGHREWYG